MFFKSKKHGVPSPAEYCMVIVLTAAIVAVILTLVGPIFLGHLGALLILLGG